MDELRERARTTRHLLEEQRVGLDPVALSARDDSGFVQDGVRDGGGVQLVDERGPSEKLGVAVVEIREQLSRPCRKLCAAPTVTAHGR